MGEEKRHPVLVVSTEWKTRAMLAAEVGERVPRDVVSVADVNEALGLIKAGGVDPAVMVVDAGQHIQPEDVRRLLEAKREVPLVLVVSRLRQEGFDALRARCAACLARPVRIGFVAEKVVGLLEAENTAG
mgnify:CR=1 FL=1